MKDLQKIKAMKMIKLRRVQNRLHPIDILRAEVRCIDVYYEGLYNIGVASHHMYSSISILLLHAKTLF